jgi:hypothetical protein
MRLVASLPARAADMSASVEALAVRFGPLPFSAMRRVRRVLADTPRSRRAIAQACGSSIERTSAILTKLVRAGLAMKVDAGDVRSGTEMPVLQDEVMPLEIGRQILLYLTEPRRAKDIVRIINRPPSNTTGQLQHRLRRGLVVRVSKGAYDVGRPDGQQVSTLSPAKQPRAEAGVPVPSEMAASIAATRSLQGI